MTRLTGHLLRRILFSIYKHLPPFLRWKISYLLSSKFLVGMIFFIEKDGSLLLVKHSYQKAWSLPGGWLKRGESIEEGARREIKEEFGTSITEIEILKTVAVKSKPVIDIALSCRFLELPESDKLEIETFDFFSFDALPPEIIRSHRSYIDEYFSRRTANSRRV